MRRLNLLVLLMMLVAGCAFDSDPYVQPEPGIHCESVGLIVGQGDKNVMVRCWMNSRPTAAVWFTSHIDYSDPQKKAAGETPTSTADPEYITIEPGVWQSEIRFNVQCHNEEKLSVSVSAKSVDGDYNQIKIDDISADCSNPQN